MYDPTDNAIDIGPADFPPTATPPWVAWQRIRGGRSAGKWTVAAAGHTEAEALASALDRAAVAAHRDLIVLRDGEQP